MDMKLRRLIEMKKIAFPSMLFACLFLSCTNEVQKETVQYTFVEGKTMGTTYHIKFEGLAYKNHQYEIDSVLIEVNQSLSTYIPNSTINLFNQTDTAFVLQKNARRPLLKPLDLHLYENFKKAKEIWKISNGAFDPTVGPLVNYWGFGSDGLKKVNEVDSTKLAELVTNTGFEKIEFEEKISRYTFIKKSPEIELDFSAIAKGFGVDEVCNFLDKKDITNYFVEIGGEVRVKGKNTKGENWRIGINTPDTEAKLNDFFAIIPLDNKSMASSGNYRNFYEVNGIKRFHSINPKTGFPEENELRSATIISEDCMTADALATTCMVLGLKRAKSLIFTMDNISALLIFENKEGDFDYFASSGLDFELLKTSEESL